MSVISSRNVETLILGAWGCGVFGQNPERVAQLFKEELQVHGIRNVVFAIIDKPTYDIFTKVLKAQKTSR